MAIAIGGSTNTVAPNGHFCVNVLDYGARPGVSFDNGPIFQAAHDAMAARLATAPPGMNWKGTIYVPGSAQPYNVATTTYVDGGNIVFAGDGNGTNIQSGNLVRVPGVLGNVSCPVFALGYRRPSTIGGSYAANFSTYRPDLFGKLDSSICNASGQRWGFRTNTNAFVMAHGSPFSHGGQSPTIPNSADFWAETNTLTVEFAVEGFASGKVANGSVLFGTGDNGHSYPVSVRTDGDTGNWVLQASTQAARFGPVNSTTVVLGAQQTGVQRVTIQIDLVSGSIAAWVNGLQIYTSGIVSGGHFAENDDFPFMIAGTGIWDSWAQTFPDFAVYGLAMSKTLRYNIGANGSPQVRTAGATTYASIRDNYRYLDDSTDRGNGTTTGIFAYFYFCEAPNINDPMVFIGGSGGGAQPAFIGLGANLTPGGICGIGLRDLRLGATRGYGAPVYIDIVLETTLDNLDLRGGLYALASIPHVSNYPVVINRCYLSTGNGDAAVYLALSIARIRDCLISNGGRATMRFRASDVIVDGMFISGNNPNCQFSVARAHNGDNGGQYEFSNILQDCEGDPFPSRAALMFEADLGGSYVHLQNVAAGNAPGVPFVVLESFNSPPNFPSNVLESSNSSSQLGSAFVQTNGSAWSGTFTANSAGPGCGQAPHLIATGARPPLRFNDSTYPAPPHGGSWYAGPHRLTVPMPADGQYTEWRCVKTGTYGTATPPQWAGLNALQASPQSLASYAMDHTVIAMTAMGGSSYGWYADNLTASALQKLVGGFGGQDMSTPTSLQFGLATSVLIKAATGVPSEPSGNGYARVSLTNNLTNFPAASAGTKANATAITWPTLTGPITGIVGVFVADQSGRLMAYLNFATPQTFTSGQAPSIPIGGLTFTQTSLNLNGGLSRFGWAKVADCYFGGVPLVSPSTWFVGLNTVHAALASTPAEPSGNAYARVGLTNDSGHWATGWSAGFYVVGSNAAAPTFATPTGAGWGTILGAGLFDAATSGNCWFTGDAPNPVVAGAGSTPTVAQGALLISI
jgi:hypothetical protein